MKKPVFLFTLFAIILFSNACLFAEEGKGNNRQLLFDLGILKYGKANLKGQREVLVLKEGPIGVFTHQNLTGADGNSFKEILRNNGLVRKRMNKKTKKMENHILVFNPKDKNTYTWIPFTEARLVAKRIKKTGKTLPPKNKPNKITDETIIQIDNELEF